MCAIPHVRDISKVMAIVLIASSFPSIAATCSHEFFRPYYKTRNDFCRTGELVTDFYTGKHIRCEEAEIDHVVSLREAYLGGACGDDLKRLARDPDNLRLTHWTINRRKGALLIEDFVYKASVSNKHRALKVATGIRERYGVLSREDALANQAANYFARSEGRTKILPIAALRAAKGVTQKVVGKRTLYFVGSRLIGYTAGIGLAIDTVTLLPDGFSALGSSVSTEDEVSRADYIKELLQ